MTEDEALALIAAVERESKHPLAQAVARHADAADAARWDVQGFSSMPGQGAVGTVDGKRVAVGTTRLMEAESVDLGPIQQNLATGGQTAVLASVDGRAIAVIGIADAVRPTSAAAVPELAGLGVEVVMLTGGNTATAQRIGAQLGVTK